VEAFGFLFAVRGEGDQYSAAVVFGFFAGDPAALF
jgi:hypothetical protein